MPYPKGIKTPEVRAAWLAQRRKKVAEYDSLVAGGLPRYKAAHAVGSDLASIESTRRSIEHLEAGGPLNSRGQSGCIDLGLALLACLLKPGESLTTHDIAAWCGCSRAAIQRIEERALRKVRQRLVEAAHDQELAEEVREMFARSATAI